MSDPSERVSKAAANAGTRQMGVYQESPYAYGLEEYIEHAAAMEPGTVGEHASKWAALARDIDAAVDEFSASVRSATDSGWTGSGIEAIKNGISGFVSGARQLAVNADGVSRVTTELSSALSSFKANVHAPELRVWDHMFFEEDEKREEALRQARQAMSSFYNPAVAAVGSSTPNPTPPYNPVVGEPVGSAASVSGGGGVSPAGQGFVYGGGSGQPVVSPERSSSQVPGRAAPIRQQTGADAMSDAPKPADVNSGSGVSGQIHRPRDSTVETPNVFGRAAKSPDAIASERGFTGSVAAGRPGPRIGSGDGRAGSAGKGLGGIAEPGVRGGGGGWGARALQSEQSATQAAARSAAAGPSGTPVGGRGVQAASRKNGANTHLPSKLLQSTKNGEEIVGPDDAHATESVIECSPDVDDDDVRDSRRE